MPHPKVNIKTPAYILATFPFGLGKDTLREDDFDLLKKAVLLIQKKYPHVTLTVVGHTDNTRFKRPSSLMTNEKLSLARAQNIVALLVKNGVDSNHLVARGMGETMPLVPNDSPAHKANNRRVELWSSTDLSF